MSPPSEGFVFVGVNVPRDLRDAIRKLAKERDRSFSAEVRQALAAHVKAKDAGE